MRVALSAVVVVMTACVGQPPAVALELPGVGAVAQERCARIDGVSIGALPLEVSVAGRTVRLAEWTQVDEASASVVGFAAQVPADVVFTVHAGQEQFSGRGARWLHPAGVVGPRVHAIDAVTFCRQGGSVVDEGLALAK